MRTTGQSELHENDWADLAKQLATAARAPLFLLHCLLAWEEVELDPTMVDGTPARRSRSRRGLRWCRKFRSPWCS